MFLIYISFGFFMFLYALNGIRTGKISSGHSFGGNKTFYRDGDSVDFWFNIILYLVFGIAFICWGLLVANHFSKQAVHGS